MAINQLNLVTLHLLIYSYSYNIRCSKCLKSIFPLCTILTLSINSSINEKKCHTYRTLIVINTLLFIQLSRLMNFIVIWWIFVKSEDIFNDYNEELSDSYLGMHVRWYLVCRFLITMMKLWIKCCTDGKIFVSFIYIVLSNQRYEAFNMQLEWGKNIGNLFTFWTILEH